MLDTKNMSPIEKIRAMEELWASLNEGEVPPETPDWHGRVRERVVSVMKRARRRRRIWHR